MNFFKLVLANLTAWTILLLGGVMGFILLLLLMVIATAGNVLREPENDLLVIDLQMNISDQANSVFADPFGDVLTGPRVPEVSLRELTTAIDKAAEDEGIKGIFLYGNLASEGYRSGFAALQEFRSALLRFRDTGKPIYGYLINPSIRDFYLCTAASELWMNPFGLIEFNGLASNTAYIGDTLDKYGIGVQATRAGKYKSAVDPFISNEMSDADREQLQTLLDSLWGQMTTAVSETRGVSRESLERLINEKGFFEAEEAEEAKLVDQVGYQGELFKKFEKLVGLNEERQSFKQISLEDYLELVMPELTGLETGPFVAVVYMQGDIISGDADEGWIGSDYYASLLRVLAEDPEVQAVVLRVNSPGGSAIASEVIARAASTVREKKPVVVSMGSLAASGGFWIATEGDKIFAEPGTITGSIGVFGLIPNIQELALRQGVNFETVQTSPLANVYTITRPRTEEEMEIVQDFTDFIYERFLQKVASSRGLPMEKVREIAQGRVWSGADALSVGLVDQIGGLEAAIEEAAGRANLSPERFLIREYPARMTFGEALASAFSEEEETPLVQHGMAAKTWKRLQREIRWLQTLNDPRGVYARLPYQLTVD